MKLLDEVECSQVGQVEQLAATELGAQPPFPAGAHSNVVLDFTAGSHHH